MKTALLFFVGILVTFVECRKNCDKATIPNELCNRDSLIVIDPISPDMRVYGIRNDSSLLFGHTSAIKHVDNIGEISWSGNNAIGILPPNESYLFINNYVDTSWFGLEYWAYHRESITIKMEPFDLGKQKIFDEKTYLGKRTKNYAMYIRWDDDILDASWDIDLTKDNFVNVTIIDKDAKIVEGEFSLNFTKRGEGSASGIVYSDKIQFRCGTFKAKVF